MDRMITTLQQLQLLRHQAVDNLSTKLSQQKQISNRCNRNIDALNSLACGVDGDQLLNSTMMVNHSAYKSNIQRVVNWQLQQKALAEAEARQIQIKLLAEAKREKSVELLLEMRRNEIRSEQDRREQKQTDASSAQSWQRQQNQQKGR